MFCTKCGQMVPDKSKFCQSCGAKIDSAVEEEVSAQEVVEQPEAAKETVIEQSAAAEETVTEQPEEQDQAESSVSAVEEAAYEQATPAQAEMVQDAAAGAAAQGAVYEQPVQEGAQQAAYGQAAAQTVAKKGMSKPLLFGLIGGGAFLVVAAIVLVIVFVVIGGNTTYNLKDYTNIEFEGVNGSGTCTATIDEQRLATDVAKGMGIDVDKLKNSDYSQIFSQLGEVDMADMMAMVAAIGSVKVNVDKQAGLSNGDTINITYTFDEEKAKKAKANFVGEPNTKTVNGLAEVKEIDPFEGLQISYEGVSPNAYVSLSNVGTDESERTIWFEADKRDGLKVGDKIIVKVQGYDENSFATTYGVKFTQTEKEYTVEGLDAYLTENTELEDAALNVMKDATQTYVEQYFSDGTRKGKIKGSNIKYEGYYLMTNKETNVWYEYNKVYMIFSATVSSKEKPKKFKPTKVYFPVEYDDIKKLSSGEYDISTTYKRILGSTNLKFGFWETVSGYKKQSEMREELIEAEHAKYDGFVYGDLDK